MEKHYYLKYHAVTIDSMKLGCSIHDVTHKFMKSHCAAQNVEALLSTIVMNGEISYRPKHFLYQDVTCYFCCKV